MSAEPISSGDCLPIRKRLQERQCKIRRTLNSWIESETGCWQFQSARVMRFWPVGDANRPEI